MGRHERRTQVSQVTLGIIGTGMVGRAVARRATDAGLHVVLSNSRGPGTLAESWRSEPHTPLYALPYIGQPPSGLTPQEFVAWAQQATGIPVPATRIKELAAAAVRGPAGFRM
ncbi:NAD(P)-dependent oxidoreductase [Streptomyces sp. NPDC021212]|uniref:NAD(P)-dependent oxidoreductase n=1 Tax=Streptomyces sp. NPDC021212 TaxID=3365118 RepID=UPI0037B07546